MTDATIKLKLKQDMLALNGKPARTLMRLRNTDKCKLMNDQDYDTFTRDKTLKELTDLTPVDTLGEYLIHILSNCIILDNNAKAAEVYSYISKINNIKLTAKAEWEMTKDELDKFKNLLATAKQNMSANINGQVTSVLEIAWADIITKSNKPVK